MLEKAGIAYNTVLAEDVKELVERYDIKQAPTLIARKDEKIEILTGVPAIKSFI
jgi:ribonucleoside-triphosphate reductase